MGAVIADGNSKITDGYEAAVSAASEVREQLVFQNHSDATFKDFNELVALFEVAD